MKFSVLMSVYYKEKSEYLDECLRSLENQTLKADEWVIVQDGPIGDDLLEVIKKYKNRGNNIVDVILEKNSGLGIALSYGVLACKYDVIARMDTDDIARSDRFKLQIEFLKERNLDLCGSHIKEFETNDNEFIAERKVPLLQKDIEKYQKFRSAFNHMTVMYKKNAVLKAGNYKDCPLMEDDLLWVNMLQTGCKCANIDDYLVYARTNSDMISRRGGLKYFRRYKTGRKRIKETGFINYYEYKKTCIIQFLVCILPPAVRKKIFFGKLHKKVRKQ